MAAATSAAAASQAITAETLLTTSR